MSFEREWFEPDDADTIAALTKHITRLEGALKKVIIANRQFLNAVPHMREECDPVTVACQEAWIILYPENDEGPNTGGWR